jgi:flagellar basal body-associated protein FliL
LDKIIVNIKNTLGQRYLVVEMILEGADTSFSTAAEGIDYKFKDIAIGILRQKSIQDLEQELAQDIIRGELKNAFNNFLSKGKEPMVRAIYFRSFAVQ